MIHIINFIVKVLATLILFFPIGGCLTLLAIVFWNAEFINVADDILENMIWKKR